jgi:hypothetical protein
VKKVNFLYTLRANENSEENGSLPFSIKTIEKRVVSSKGMRGCMKMKRVRMRSNASSTQAR